MKPGQFAPNDQRTLAAARKGAKKSTWGRSPMCETRRAFEARRQLKDPTYHVKPSALAQPDP